MVVFFSHEIALKLSYLNFNFINKSHLLDQRHLVVFLSNLIFPFFLATLKACYKGKSELPDIIDVKN